MPKSQKKDLVPTRHPNAYSGLVETIAGVQPQSDDLVTMQFINGIAKITVRKPTGEVLTQTKHFDSNYVETTVFNGNIDIERRQKLVSSLYNGGLSQREIADRIGVSQSTVSNDLRSKR